MKTKTDLYSSSQLKFNYPNDQQKDCFELGGISTRQQLSNLNFQWKKGGSDCVSYAPLQLFKSALYLSRYVPFESNMVWNQWLLLTLIAHNMWYWTSNCGAITFENLSFLIAEPMPFEIIDKSKVENLFSPSWSRCSNFFNLSIFLSKCDYFTKEKKLKKENEISISGLKWLEIVL